MVFIYFVAIALPPLLCSYDLMACYKSVYCFIYCWRWCVDFIDIEHVHNHSSRLFYTTTAQQWKSDTYRVAQKSGHPRNSMGVRFFWTILYGVMHWRLLIAG